MFAVRKIKESKKLPSWKDVQSTEMEGDYVMCEIGETGEQQPVRVKAPPQKRRAVIMWSQRKRRTSYRCSKGLKNLVNQSITSEKESGDACGIGRNARLRHGVGEGVGDLGQEEIEELSFVPSSVSEPQWALHMCDNKCVEEGFKFFQLAATVTEEGGTVHTTNVCILCHNERRLKQGGRKEYKAISKRSRFSSTSWSWSSVPVA